MLFAILGFKSFANFCCAMSKDGLFLYHHSFDGSNLKSNFNGKVIDPECTVVRNAMNIRLHVMGILSNFACSKSTTSERFYFPPSKPGIFKYKVDEAGKPKTVKIADMEIAFDDVEDMNKFQNLNTRVIGFVKTSRGFAIEGSRAKTAKAKLTL